MTAPDRSALLAAARSGDAVARDELVRAHLDTVRAVCGSRLRSPHDVADATQETFARAFSSLDQVRDADALASWLRAIAVRVCADHGRLHLRSVTVADPVGDTPCDAPGPSELVLAGEEAHRLHATLATLGTRDRQALWLRDAIGLPVAHVAADLGVTEGSARVLLARARQRLRVAYEGVAGIAAAGLLRLRGRLADLGPVDPRVAFAAQLTIVAVAVGVAVPVGGPDAPPPRVGDADAPATVVVPRRGATAAEGGTDEPARAFHAGTRGPEPAPARPDRTGDPAAAPLVVVADEGPREPSRFGVAAGDGDGGIAGIELWGGPLTDGDDDGDDEGSIPVGPVQIVPGRSPGSVLGLDRG